MPRATVSAHYGYEAVGLDCRTGRVQKAPYSITEVDKGLVSALEAYYIELHKGKDRADSARAAVYRFNEVLVPSERSIFPYFESTFDKVVLIFEQTKGNPVIHITQVVERYLYIMRCKQRAEVLMQQVDDAAELYWSNGCE